MQNKYLVKIISEKEIQTQELSLENILQVAENVYDNKTIFIGFKKEVKKLKEFWEDLCISKLNNLKNVFFIDVKSISNLNKEYAREIVKRVNKFNGNAQKKIFIEAELPEKEDYQKKESNNEVQGFSGNIKEDNIDYQDVFSNQNQYLKVNKNLDLSLNKKEINMDGRETRKTQYSKEEFLDIMNNYKDIDFKFYQLLIKTFETVNNIENQEGYFNIPVSVVPRNFNEESVFEENENTFLFTITDHNGRSIAQDSIELSKMLLKEFNTYHSIGLIVLILINGSEYVDYQHADQLCELLDIPIYYNKEKNEFYKTYAEKLYSQL